MPDDAPSAEIFKSVSVFPGEDLRVTFTEEGEQEMESEMETAIEEDTEEETEVTDGATTDCQEAVSQDNHIHEAGTEPKYTSTATTHPQPEQTPKKQLRQKASRTRVMLIFTTHPTETATKGINSWNKRKKT